MLKSRYVLICGILFGLFYTWWSLPGSLVDIPDLIPSWGDIVVGKPTQITRSNTATIATTTKITVTGDVFLGRDVEDSALLFDYTYSLHLFSTWPFSEADATIINFEAPIPAQHIPTPDFNMRFSVATSAVPALASAGVTHIGLANNHTGDHGISGLLHTQKQFTAAGLEVFGDPWAVGTTSVTEIQTVNGNLVVVALQTVNTTPDIAALQSLFASLPAAPAGVVAYVHWGEEYRLTPSTQQRLWANLLIENGADLIIGHHPHVVQDIEVIDGVPVFYSLGNTVFDQYFSSDVQNGLVITLNFDRTHRLINLYPISSIGSRTRPYLMPARERRAFLQDLANRSDSYLSESIQSGTMVW